MIVSSDTDRLDRMVAIHSKGGYIAAANLVAADLIVSMRARGVDDEIICDVVLDVLRSPHV